MLPYSVISGTIVLFLFPFIVSTLIYSFTVDYINNLNASFIRVAGWVGEQTIFDPKLTRDLAIRVGIIDFTREIATVLEFFFKFRSCNFSCLRNIFCIRNSCNALRH